MGSRRTFQRDDLWNFTGNASKSCGHFLETLKCPGDFPGNLVAMRSILWTQLTSDANTFLAAWKSSEKLGKARKSCEKGVFGFWQKSSSNSDIANDSFAANPFPKKTSFA
jgi:hypothetical protein